MLENIRQEAPKDRWGRYLVSSPDGKQRGYTRVTTISSTTDDTNALKQWANRMVITGLVNRSDLLAQASTKLEDKGALNKIADEAITAGGGSSRANLGTALHSITEQVDLGNKPAILPGLQADVNAYVAELKRCNIKILKEYIESVVINDTLEYAGTLDRIVEVNGVKYIADLKTGTDLSYSWRSISIQLNAYAQAEHIYDWKTSTRQPMPDINREMGIVFHLPAGEARCELYWVDLTAGQEGLRLALDVRAWRKRNDIHQRFVEGKVVELPVVEVAETPYLQPRKEWLTARIIAMPSEAQMLLKATWPDGVPKISECTNDQLDEVVEVLQSVETSHNVQFFMADPTKPPKPRKTAKPKVIK
ncbi:MAG: hypothetical protein EBU12_05710 [Microbacteriaceae bacterium]|nr:hypothetical protein [Microbacteriaceae bacterium]